MKTVRLLAALFAAIILCACNGGDDSDKWLGDFGGIKVPDTRQLEQTTWADQTQAPQQVKFTTDGAWDSSIAETTRTEVPAWITISPDHGDAAGSYTIRLTLEKNGTGADRTAAITIHCGESTITITITQKAHKEDGGNVEEDPEELKSYEIRRIVEYNADGSEAEHIAFKFETDPPFRITALSYFDAGESAPYTTHTFSYTGSSQMRYVAAYTDKGVYGYTTEATGYFGTETRIESAERAAPADNNKTNLDFNYTGNFIDRITFRYPSPEGDGLYNWHTDTYAWQQNNCNRIIWNTENPEPDMQEYVFNQEDKATNKDLDSAYGRLLDGRNIDVALLLIEEPDVLRALGFYGVGNAFLPKKVTTKFGNVPTTQEFSYSYSLENIPSKSEGEGMRITIKEFENGKQQSTKTYGVIVYPN